MRALRVLATGPSTLVQDRGRPGLAHLGVSPSGAADRWAHALADRLVGNPADAATLEVTAGGLAVRACGALTVAVTGADAEPACDGEPFGIATVRHVRDGQVLTLGMARRGVRSYLAVRGGIDVAPELGARSHDVLGGLGPPPVADGDLLPVGAPDGPWPVVDVAPVALPRDGAVTLRVVRGPRDEYLLDPDALVRGTWTASARSDRVGLRLDGEPLRLRAPAPELASEGTVRGAIQVPPGGLPVILGPDHPVTGGYPVAAVVLDADLDATAQLRPGQAVNLRWAGPIRAR